MSRIAIVGGAGFIGSWLARALAPSNEVTILDIETPPADVAALCPFVRCDVREPGSLRGRLDGAETVYLLAGLLARRCDLEPEVGWQTNIAGTANAFAELAGSATLRRVVFFSSSMVYDSTCTQFPLTESAPVAGERLYDQSKLIGEELLRTFCACYGVEGLIFRFFSIYGPGRFLPEKGHFIATWIDMARRTGALTIHGDGSQTIDLLHVDDAVRSCVLAEARGIERGTVQTFNVGCGEDTPVRSVAGWIRDVSPDVEFRNEPGPKAQIMRRWADITKASRDLGYRPTVTPRDGVTALARERLGSPE